MKVFDAGQSSNIYDLPCLFSNLCCTRCSVKVPQKNAVSPKWLDIMESLKVANYTRVCRVVVYVLRL